MKGREGSLWRGLADDVQPDLRCCSSAPPHPPLTAVTDVLLTSAASHVLSRLCKSKTLEEEEHQQKQRWPQPKLIGEQVLEIALAIEARGVMFSLSPSSQTYDLSDSCTAVAAATTRHA